jgi:hypothetical protein
VSPTSREMIVIETWATIAGGSMTTSTTRAATRALAANAASAAGSGTRAAGEALKTASAPPDDAEEEAGLPTMTIRRQLKSGR